MSLRLKKQEFREFVGSWFEFPDPSEAAESYWNESVRRFSEDDWHEKLREMSEIGIGKLLLGPPVLGGKSFYPSEHIEESWNTGCSDLVEALLSAADRLGMEVYLAPGIGGVDLPIGQELVDSYGAHSSFAGWQIVPKRGIETNLDEQFVSRINDSVATLKNLAQKPVLLSVSARVAAEEEGFSAHLRKLQVDHLLYRDGVGMRANEPADLPRIFGRLAEMHRDVEIPLWGCVEVFAFEGFVGESALVPASFNRVKTQIETVSAYADALFCCQYLGMMNPGKSRVFAGHESSASLYYDYNEWRRSRKG